MQSCLRTGDEVSAKICLDRLTERFGEGNERVMALKGLFEEAIAENDAALKLVLKGYEATLAKDPSNMVGNHSSSCSRLLIFIACVETSCCPPKDLGHDSRINYSFDKVLGCISYGCGGVGGVIRPVSFTRPLSAGDICSGRGSFDNTQCMECEYLLD